MTPFAPRVLDRGLAALLASIVRLSGSTFNKNDAAGSVLDAAEPFTAAIEAIMRRADEVATESTERVATDLEKLKAYWLKLVNTLSSLGYEQQHDDVTLGLLKRPKRGKWEPFTCLNSLRNVEPAVQLLLLDEGTVGDPAIDIIEDVP